MSLTNIKAKIPSGYRELRSGARIRKTDRHLAYNRRQFVRVADYMVGEHYITHAPSNHWTVIRRKRRS